MTTKYTKGEWWRDGLEIGTAPTMQIKIAKVGGASIEEAEANARLIECAPKLLAVANDFKEALEELGLFCTCGEPDCRTTRLLTVLQKVQGEKQ